MVSSRLAWHGKNAHITIHENGTVAISNNAAGDSTIDFTDKYIRAFKDFESDQKVTGKKGVYDGTQRVFSPNNRNITSDINDSSSTKYASALAVKTAAEQAGAGSMAVEKTIPLWGVEATIRIDEKWSLVWFWS